MRVETEWSVVYVFADQGNCGAKWCGDILLIEENKYTITEFMLIILYFLSG
jgi:hypothetical protein